MINYSLIFVKLNKLCTSLGGLDVPLLVIHEETPSVFSLPTKKNGYTPLPVSKKCIMISGRAHPG